MSRLTRLKHSDPFSSLFDEQYSYNTANQISQIAGLSSTKNFTYDNIDRLTGMTDGTNTESYAYDSVGNRTSSHRSATYTTGIFNRLTATTSNGYTYNANGDTIGRTGGLIWTYGWDREDRMTSASTGFASSTVQYDALGRRVKGTQGINVIKYTYDGMDVVLDDNNGTLTKYQNGPGIDNKLKQTTSGTSKYFLQNYLGSTVALTSSSGVVTDTNGYDSFGNATNSTFPSRYQYTGREYDATTGLQYSRARWYDANIGRFISEDPIGFGGGDVNLYGYVGNNPINSADPTGLIPAGLFTLGIYRNGAHLADTIDGVIDRVISSIGFDPPIAVVPFPLTSNAAAPVYLSGALKGSVDPLRVGRGIGCALYSDGLQDYERFNLISADVARGGAIALTIAGPIGGRFAGARVNPTSTALLRNGYYEVNGLKFSDYYYNRLWSTGRPGPSLVANEILQGSKPLGPNSKPGFYNYEFGGVEMIYNPSTREVWHLQPIP